jgi:co-chaperonin GroES (HSP10)
MLDALGTKIVLERVEQEQTSAAGIVLTNLQDPNPIARVLSVGDQVKIKVAVGDRVAVSWNNTATQKYKGNTYYIADETGIFAVERDND